MDKGFIDKLFSEPEYRQIVVSTIYYVVPKMNPFDLDDCISDVYLAAMKAPNLDKHPNIKGWLNLTSKNIAMRYLKKLSKNSILIADYDVDKNIASRVNLAKEAETSDEHNAIIDILLKTLSHSDYKLFKLKYIQELSAKEISNILGIKVGSVEMKCTRLRKRIKKFLNIV